MKLTLVTGDFGGVRASADVFVGVFDRHFVLAWSQRQVRYGHGAIFVVMTTNVCFRWSFNSQWKSTCQTTIIRSHRCWFSFFASIFNEGHSFESARSFLIVLNVLKDWLNTWSSVFGWDGEIAGFTANTVGQSGSVRRYETTGKWIHVELERWTWNP